MSIADSKPVASRFDQVFRSTNRVKGYTHDFYKYPARFTPNFARFILESLTEPGDWVLDPFMGGGTAIVEAVASGRHAIGSDVNELARFVTGAKTTPLSRYDIAEIRAWVRNVSDAAAGINPYAHTCESPIRNMPMAAYQFFAMAIRLVKGLRFRRRRQFARCALVRVGQWGLDSSTNAPDAVALAVELEKRIEFMLGGMEQFVSAARDAGIYKNKISSTRRLLAFSARDTLLARTLRRHQIRPKLVLTSPPYPGVHILYHRWQVMGRRETPAPYWIADLRDGHGAAHYTMGSRSPLGQRNYFSSLSLAFCNLRQVIASDARIVQLISFSNTAAQLPLYLDAMTHAGFEETNEGDIVSRKVRTIPNRKWYNQRRTRNDASREMLLVHRLVGKRRATYFVSRFEGASTKS